MDFHEPEESNYCTIFVWLALKELSNSLHRPGASHLVLIELLHELTEAILALAIMLPVTLYCRYGFLTMQKQVILSDVSYCVHT